MTPGLPPEAERTAHRTAFMQMGLAVTLLGAGWPVTKLALMDGAAPSWFALGRAGLSTLTAIVVVTLCGAWRLPARVDLPALAAFGLLQLAGFFALAHAAVAWVPAGRTAILSNAALVWTVPIALFITHEPISRRRWLAAVVSAAGVIVLVGPWAIDWGSPSALIGHAFLLGAALCWATSMTIVRRWPPRMSMLQLLPWSFALATAGLLPLALAHPTGTWSPLGLACLAAIGLVMGPVGTWCIMAVTTVLPIVVTSIGFLAGPALGLVLSIIFLGEPLTASIVAGAVLLLGAAVLAARGGAR